MPIQCDISTCEIRTTFFIVWLTCQRCQGPLSVGHIWQCKLGTPYPSMCGQTPDGMMGPFIYHGPQGIVSTWNVLIIVLYDYYLVRATDNWISHARALGHVMHFVILITTWDLVCHIHLHPTQFSQFVNPQINN